MKKVVEHKQSLIDLAVQHHGNIDSLHDLIVLNNLSITDDLEYGYEIEIGNPISNNVIENYIEKNVIPAVDFVPDQNLIPEGVGYWIIGTDFKVS